jgi:hypothetical protein
MTLSDSGPSRSLVPPIAAERRGRGAIAGWLAAIVRRLRARSRASPAGLPDYLRRDIGLPPHDRGDPRWGQR